MTRPRPWTLLLILVALSLGATAFMVLLGGDLYSPRSPGADVFSRSFVGQHGFVELLERTGRPIHVSRDPRLLFEADAAWVMTPRSPDEQAESWHSFFDRLEYYGTTAIVLPKRRPTQVDSERPGWILGAELVALPSVQRMVDAFVANVEVVRPGEAGPWDSAEGAVDVELDEPQLVKGEGIVPVVRCAEGILAGWVRPTEDWGDHAILLVADPDLVSNGGLGRGGNARLAVQLVDTILEASSGPLMVDASMQGFERVPSLLAEMLRFPLALVVVHAALLTLAALAAASRRFGRAHDPVVHPHPGKAELIENTSRLMLSAGHVGHLGKQYVRMLVRHVGEMLRAPRSEDVVAVSRWLEPLERSRTRRRSEDLLTKADALRTAGPGSASRVLTVTREMNLWREEMLRGTRTSAGAHR